MIVLQEVTKSFGKTTVLNGVSLRIDPGELVCIAGPSGSGKSTILSLMIGADVPSKGTVFVDGVDLRAVPRPALQMYRRKVGIVFQDGKLLPDRTVEENIAFPLEIRGAGDGFIGKHVAEAMERLDLHDVAGKFPRELTVSERAKAALARAIAHRPLILLADEPLADLDPVHMSAALDLFRALQREGMTIIMATHDTGVVDVLKTRVIRLEQGKVVRDGYGSYERMSRNQPKAEEPAKHDVFDDTPLSDIPLPSIEADTGAVRGKKKVKITAIGS